MSKNKKNNQKKKKKDQDKVPPALKRKLEEKRKKQHKITNLKDKKPSTSPSVTANRAKQIQRYTGKRGK